MDWFQGKLRVFQLETRWKPWVFTSTYRGLPAWISCDPNSPKNHVAPSISSHFHNCILIPLPNVVKTMSFAPSPSHHHFKKGGINLPFPGKRVVKMALLYPHYITLHHLVRGWMSDGYGSIPINTIFRGMNIHLPAILGFTRYQGFDPSPDDALIATTYCKNGGNVGSQVLLARQVWGGSSRTVLCLT